MRTVNMQILSKVIWYSRNESNSLFFHIQSWSYKPVLFRQRDQMGQKLHEGVYVCIILIRM